VEDAEIAERTRVSNDLQAGETQPEARRGRRRDGALFLLSIVICVLLVLGLVAVSRGTGSAQGPGADSIPTPDLTANEACQTWATYWTKQSGIHASVESIEGFSNCRLSKDGTWFIPTSSQDARLAGGPILSNDERAQTAALRATLNQQLLELRAEFPQALNEWLNDIYSFQPNPVLGHTKDTRIGATRGRYTRLVQAFLMYPRYSALADYLGWLMEQRQQSLASFMAGCSTGKMAYLESACQGIADRLSVYYPPWPWELSDSVSFDSYLKWALDNGKIPPTSSTALASPTPSSQDRPAPPKGGPL
jgi:hypothetical protein